MAERQANITPATGVGTALNITSSTTTLVKTGGGILMRITVGVAGGSSPTIKVYDGLTAGGTLLSTIDGGTKGSHEFGCGFLVGLCIVTATGTPGDYTIIYS